MVETDSETLRSIAAPLAEAGCLGTVALLIHRAALRRVDWDLIPSAALPRVRWWLRHGPPLLRASLTLAALGLAGLGAAWLGG
ncbi:hypothetical protein [Actinacidiphila alni]|uniref:hypothetical protein n=1 Tax=Actinacidiphila alni TaxID=380248 RepID=UPI0011607DA1|nr:hypothetical protein [Actinacidiphila alni]